MLLKRVWFIAAVVLSASLFTALVAEPRFPIPEMVVIPAGSFLMGCVSGISHLLINCVAEHHLFFENENASWRRQNACVFNSEPSNPLPICSLTATLKIPLYFEPLQNVKRWTNSNQRSRWLASALLDIQPRLRRVKGY